MQADEDLDAAWGITPARFLFERALPQLVELPALWVTIPVLENEPEDLLEAITCIVGDHALPAPHLIVTGQARIVVLWHIRPLHYPAALKADATPVDRERHERATFAFRRCLRDWKRAAVKLSLAFADVGALPHTPATVEQQLLDFIPFPLEAGHPATLVGDLVEEPPCVLRVAHHDPVLIADVSKALGAFDKAMWACFKEARPRSRRVTSWLESEATKAAMATTEPGARHRAALTIVCACVWDGLTEDAALERLRAWASTCARDGGFPYRRPGGDELELLVRWAFARLSPGGPTPRGTDPNERASRRTPLEAAAAATLAVLMAEAGPQGEVVFTLPELRREAALAAGQPKAIARSTFKRALHLLKDQGLIEHEVLRVQRTWCSRFRMAGGGHGAVGGSQVQKRESLWAPARPGSTFGGGLGDASPSGRGVRGEGQNAEDFPSRGREPDEVDSDLSELGGEPRGKPHLHRRPKRRATQKRSQLPAHQPSELAGETAGAMAGTRTAPGPVRQLSLPLDRRERRRRRRQREAPALPPLTDDLMDLIGPQIVDETVRPHLLAAGWAPVLSAEEARALLNRAWRELPGRARYENRARFESALLRRAQKLVRLDAFLALSAKQAEAERVARARRDVSRQARLEQAAQNAPDVAEPGGNPFEAVRAALQRPLHELRPPERMRRLLEHGLSLVVLAPRSKEPPRGTSWTSAQVAPARAPRLQRELEEQGDEAGLAVVCGAVSGVVVVDLDDADAVAWAETHLPTTPWRTRTGRDGGGEHWYYRCPTNGSRIPTSVPFRGQVQSDGRYVVAPGSIHPETGRVYACLGDWTRSKEHLPIFEVAWLESVADLERRRRERAAILAEDE